MLEFVSPAHRHQRRLDDARRARDFEILRAGGWTCHACGDARPDRMIGVRSAAVTRDRVVAYYNRRYCVDRPECVDEVDAQLDRLRREAANREEQV